MILQVLRQGKFSGWKPAWIRGRSGSCKWRRHLLWPRLSIGGKWVTICCRCVLQMLHLLWSLQRWYLWLYEMFKSLVYIPRLKFHRKFFGRQIWLRFLCWYLYKFPMAFANGRRSRYVIIIVQRVDRECSMAAILATYLGLFKVF